MEMNDRDLQAEAARTLKELEDARALLRQATEARHHTKGPQVDQVYSARRHEVELIGVRYDRLVEELVRRGSDLPSRLEIEQGGREGNVQYR